MMRIISYGPTKEGDSEILASWSTEVTHWKKLFASVHRTREMRIYPHIIVDHGKDVFERHGPLEKLSQQGMEHANKRDVMAWYNHTGRGGGAVKVTSLKYSESNTFIQAGLTVLEAKNERLLRFFMAIMVLPYIVS